MAMEHLHDIAEKLHTIDQERSLNTVENESVRLMRKLCIDLVHHVQRLEDRIATLEGRPPTD